MYLGLLDEEEKALYLELAIHMAMADEKLEKEEKTLLGSYCWEMGLPFREDYKVQHSLDEVISQLNQKCTEKERKIVYIELAGLAMADNDYADSEKSLMEKIRKGLDISEKTADSIFNSVIELKELYNRLADILDE